MKKVVKRMLSLLLVVVTLIGIVPLNGLVGLDFPAWEKFEKITAPITDFFNGFTALKANAANMSEGSYKIVLKWGSSPRDLDTHIEGTLSNGTAFHCYYSNKNIYDNGKLVVNLDVDDTSGYGPETLTIDPKVINGNFTYYVYNYSGSGSIPASGASVSLYKGEELIEEFTVSGSGTGRYWTLFHVENGKIYLVDEISTSVSNNHKENLGGSVEEVLYKNGIPVLSSNDAKNFLCFIYNEDKNFSGADSTLDLQYKLLTGNLPRMSTDETKGLISSFILIVGDFINSYISTAEYQSNYCRESLIQRLENELGGMQELDEQIINEYTGTIETYIEEGITELLTGIVGRTTGVYITEEVLDNVSLVFSGVNTILEIPEKVETYCNRIMAAVEAGFLVFADENLGRYGYFNTYISNRHIGQNEIFQVIMDSAFLSFSDRTFLSKFVDLFTWITGEDSWTNHRDDLDRWAEYLYQLCEYQKKDPHNYTKTIYNPTCTTEGYTEYSCQYCGEVFHNNYKNALGHKFTKSVIKPGCEYVGYDLYECTRCSYRYSSNETPATGHTCILRTIYESTCINNGYDLCACSCGISWKENEKPAKGHSYIHTVIEPTETEQGYTYHKCSECSKEYYSDYTDPIGHTFISTVTDPTCESDGYTTHTCSDCGYEYTDNIIKSLGCSYTVSNKEEASCVAEGLVTYSCEKCGNSYTETLPVTEHDYSYSVCIIEAACDEQGYTVYRCECGETITDNYIEAYGHSYSVVEQKEVTCVENGYKTYECANCKDTYTEIETAQGHLFEVVETIEAGCLTSGYTLQVCSICGCEHHSNVIPPKDHTLGKWVVLKDDMGSLSGRREAKCINCDFVYTEDNPSYKVEFTVDGEVYDSYECPYGEKLTAPSAPEKEGYVFADWSPEIPETMPDMEMVFIAVFEPVIYTATFMEGDRIMGTDEFVVSDASLDYPEIEEKTGYEWVWEEHRIIAGDITVNGNYSIITYTADFVIDGEIVSSQQFNVLEPELNVPEIPRKEGYSSAWEEYEGVFDNLTVNAIYTPIVYTATFTSGDEIIGIDEFTVEDVSLDYPAVAEKAGYDWVWEEHAIIPEDITVNGDYSIINYTATFVADGETVESVSFTVENQTVVAPEIPHKDGYTYEWEHYEVSLADFTVNAVYTPIIYTATFTSDGEIIGTDEFTVEDASLDYPSMEKVEHYDWVWDEHSIQANDITVAGGYTPTIYTATFIANGETVSVQQFSVEDKTVISPEIPPREGYTSIWQGYQIELVDFTVNAVYTPIKYKATFVDGDKWIGEDYFTVEDMELDYPPAPIKQYYEWNWDPVTVTLSDITVTGYFSPVTYTATFVSNGKTVKTQKFTVENYETVCAPACTLPQKSGYTRGWEKYEGIIGNITVNEIYLPNNYTAYCYCEGELIETRTFTVETTEERFLYPTVPGRSGYTVEWTEFEAVPRNINLYAEYVPIEYTAQFVVDGDVISTQKFTVETVSLNEPSIPPKAGFVSQWSYYRISVGDKTITPVYYYPEVITLSRRTLYVGDTTELVFSSNFEETKKVWSSSDNSVATVDKSGKVTAKGEGKCNVTVTCYGKDSAGNDIEASSSTTIIVKEKTQPKTFKQQFREAFNEFFQVKLHDIIHNFKDFMFTLVRYTR